MVYITVWITLKFTCNLQITVWFRCNLWITVWVMVWIMYHTWFSFFCSVLFVCKLVDYSAITWAKPQLA